MAQRLRLNRGGAHAEVTLSEEGYPVEKQKLFGEKNKQASERKPGQGQNNEPKDQSQKLSGGPGERSDEESIGRPVQLDKDPQKPRQPGEGHQEDRPRTEPSGV